MRKTHKLFNQLSFHDPDATPVPVRKLTNNIQLFTGTVCLIKSLFKFPDQEVVDQVDPLSSFCKIHNSIFKKIVQNKLSKI